MLATCSACLGSSRRTSGVSALAVRPVTAVELDAAALRAMADQDPSLGYPLLRGMFDALVSRLHGTRARLVDMYRSPRDR